MTVYNIRTLSSVNKKLVGGLTSTYVYIGRRNQTWGLQASALANPYLISESCSREQAIALYRKWLWAQIKHVLAGGHSPAVEALVDLAIRRMEGEEFALVCWCHPEPCHGDVVDRAINWVITDGRLLKLLAF